MRGRSLKRRTAVRAQRKKFYIYSEGENTEPLYLKAYERFLASATIEVIQCSGGNAPKTLRQKSSERARELQSRRYIRENGDRDQVWVIFDRDDHKEVPETIQYCQEHGIGVAHSNPCFEVWLILHFKDYDKDEDRSRTQAECEKTCRGYDKDSRKCPELSELMSYVEVAEQRADAMLLRREREGGDAPRTTVHELTRAMREV